MDLGYKQHLEYVFFFGFDGCIGIITDHCKLAHFDRRIVEWFLCQTKHFSEIFAS
jgi:hypothetical protein